MSYKFEELEDIEYIKKNPLVVKIEGFDYEIDTDGNIYNNKGMILKQGNDGHGYNMVKLTKDTKVYNKKVHRLVCETFINNDKNKRCVDHVDNNRKNNNLYNLRYATDQENQFNRKKGKNNKSGIKGVHYDKKNNKWISSIKINGKIIYIGRYDNINEAKIARQEKAEHYFKEYINKCEK